MSSRLRSIASICLSSLALAACGGGHSALPAATNTQSNPVTPYNGAPQLAAFSWGKDALSQAQYAGPANVGNLSVDVQLRMQNQPGLLQYAAMVSDPHSGLYRHFLTPQDIGARFGASQADYNTVVAYFAKYHLGVASWPQRLSMVVSGKQSDLEAAFGTKFGFYRAYGQAFVAPTIQPHFSQALPVSAVSRLVHMNLNHRFLIRAGNGNFFGMSGPQLRRAFDFTGAAAKGFNGSGITVGIIGTGPILTGSSGDTASIGKLYNEQVASVSLAPVLAQSPSPANNNTGTSTYDPYPSGLQTPPPLTGSCTPPGATQPLGSGVVSASCNPEDAEAQLDTEQIAQLAPGANVLFYLAYNNLDCDTAAPYNNPYQCPTGATGVIGVNLADDEIQQAIADNSVDVLSLSYGFPESLANASGYFDNTGAGPGPLEFAALASEGIAVFAASGDNGAHACFDPTTGAPTAAFCVYYPASDPSVVAVGGVNYPMDSSGNLPPSAQITAWASNTTLGGDGLSDNSPGSGGGVSQFFSATSAHQTILPASIQGTSTGAKRVLPDLSMLGDPLTGAMVLMYASGFPGSGPAALPVGGTSAAAPEMAAAWAVVLQACKASTSCATGSGTHPWRLGDPKAVLYGIYGKPATYASTFYDVVAGSNGDLSNAPSPAYYPGYSAGTGFDLVTGMGVPFVGHLINAVVPGQNVP